MNVHCTLNLKTNSLLVYRGHDLVALVTEGLDGPEVTVFGNTDSLRVLTFNDLDIITDNWNQMQEIRKDQAFEANRRCSICGQINPNPNFYHCS